MAIICLPKADSEILNNLLKAYCVIFFNKKTPVGVFTSLPEAEINTGSVDPIKMPMYHLPLQKWKTVGKCVEDMLKDRIICPSSSPRASPTLWYPNQMEQLDSVWTTKSSVL